MRPACEFAAAGLVCSFCGQPLGAATATVQTVGGRRHAFVFTFRDAANGRRNARCLEISPEAFASDEGLRSFMLRMAAVRRAETIRLELQGLAP